MCLGDLSLGPCSSFFYIGGDNDIIKTCDLDVHFYADDNQIYSSCAPYDNKTIIAVPGYRLHFEHQGLAAGCQWPHAELHKDGALVADVCPG